MVVHSAYMLINKAIPSTGGPYTVRFYDDNGDLIQTDVNIPQYGTAHCTLLDGTIVNGLYFKGWNPSPSVVTRNLDCYPVRGDYIIRHEETHDSWETICADGGAHYPLGTYKSLNISVPSGSRIPFELTHIYINGDYFDSGTRNYSFSGLAVALDMVKVAEGEDGSTSTWLSTGTINFGSLGVCPSYGSNVRTWADTFSFSSGGYDANCDWGNVFLRKYLNEYLLAALPTPIKTNAKDVTKYYSSWNVSPSIYYWGGSRLQKSSMDKIWVPSMKELHTMFAAASNYSDYSATEEFEGIDYSSVYVPSYGKFAVRSCHLGANYINPLFLYGTITPIDQGCGRFPFGFCL